MENILRTPCRVHLRENSNKDDALNPLAPGAGELVCALIDDVLRLMPGVRFFHVGGDEAWSFGTHPDTRSYIESHGPASLYLHHMEPILDHVMERGMRPMIWHDMLSGWEDDMLQRIAPKCDLVAWGYHGHPDEVDRHYHSGIIERFHRNGLVLWGATAFKGADGTDADLPALEQRRVNGLAWVEMAQRYDMVGLISTGWSRYHSNSTQCESIEAALNALLMHAIILHDGAFEPTEMARLPELLNATGEGERFNRLQKAMETFSHHRNIGWHSIRIVSQHLTVVENDPRKRLRPASLDRMKGDLDRMDATVAEVRDALNGLVPSLWIERYLSERVGPLHQMAERLAKQRLKVAKREA